MTPVAAAPSAVHLEQRRVLDELEAWLATLPDSVQVGNRQLDAALHRIAVTQLRVHPAARAYLMRQRAAGKSRREALRVLKRRLARVVFNLRHADLDQSQLGPSAAPVPAPQPAA